MFERYTEKARRVIFFARYEASNFGSPYIETEHLLLGLMREDVNLRARLLESGHTIETVRKQVESQMPPAEKISLSVDLPLSEEAKRVLAFAAEEGTTLGHDSVNCGHLVLGLLREEQCFAAALLRQYGIDYAGYRDIVSRSADAPSGQPHRRSRVGNLSSHRGVPELKSEPAASSLGPAVSALHRLLNRAVENLEISEAYARRPLKRKAWSRKEALGHLIDLAASCHSWFALALTEPAIVIASYPQDDWVAAQKYDDLSWMLITDCWISLQRLLIHVLIMIPEEKVNISCRVGIEEPIPLLKLIERYVAACEDILGQVLSKL